MKTQSLKVNILNINNKNILPRFHFWTAILKIYYGRQANSLPSPSKKKKKKTNKKKKTKQNKTKTKTKTKYKTNLNKTKQKHKNDHSIIKLVISGLFTWCCYPCAVCMLGSRTGECFCTPACVPASDITLHMFYVFCVLCPMKLTVHNF